MREEGVDGEIVDHISHLVKEQIMRTLEPLARDFVDPEHFDFVMAYVAYSIGMINHSDLMRTAVGLGYNVHGDEDGNLKIPDLSPYMPEIAEAFEGYMRDVLPEAFAGSDFMDEERLNGIVREVRDHLFDNPPNFEGVMDMAEQLNLSDEMREMIMRDMKDYMNHMIVRILEDMGFPHEELYNTAASMAYALGSLSDKDYMMAMGGAFGGADMGAVEDFLYNTYEMPNVDRISFEIYDTVTNYMYDNLPSLGLREDQIDVAV